MSVHFHRTPMKEIHREPFGLRWCFTHRRREQFDYVVHATVEPSYYDPNPSIVGPTSECRDLFPGHEWEWLE